MPSPPFYVMLSSAERNTNDNYYDFRVEAINNPLFWSGHEYELTDIYIANSIYTFDTSNNKVYFQENLGGVATATITPGVYDSSSFPAQLKAALEAASINVRTYTVTYSSSTMKLTVAVSAGTVKFMFGSNTTNSAAQRMGWSTYKIAPVDDTAASSIVGPYLIDFAYPLQLAITIDGFDATISSGKKSAFCQVIVPFEIPSANVVHYSPIIPPKLCCIDNITQVHVRITDPLSGLAVFIQQDFTLVFCRKAQNVKY